MILLCLLVALLPVSQAIKYNLELADRYRKYEACLRRRQAATHNDGALHVQPIEVVRGSDVVLPCFTCVAPEDALEIESTYKPSAGAIGRVFKKVVDYFRSKLLGAAAFDKYKWTYDWEYASMGQGWETLTNVHTKKSLGEHISTKVRRFLKRDDAKWTLGDQYELRLRNVDRNNSGFYRCINRKVHGKKSRVARMGAMHFLDVKTRLDWRMFASKENNLSASVLKLFPKANENAQQLKVEVKAGMWSSCSRCGSQPGEQMRAIQCVISPTTEFLSQLGNKSAWLQMFGHVPCSSSLVPLELRRHHKAPKIIQYKNCHVRCYSNTTTERYINSTDDLGEKRVMDYLPKGEFLFGEILPKLLPPIIRRGYLLTEGDDLVLTCDIDPNEGLGVHWHSKTELSLTVNRILEKFNGRVWLDEQGRLIFNQTAPTDQDMYYCYNSEGILLSVHNVMIKKNQQTAFLVSCFSMVFKGIVLALIMVLVVKKLMGR